MAKIVVIGSCNIDVTVECDRFAHPGETLFGNKLNLYPGGKGANQAVAAARLGAKVAMVGCIGDDMYGEMMLKTLKENNIDCSCLEILPGENTGTAHITVAEDDNTIYVVKAANDKVEPKHVDAALEKIKAADLVMLQHEIPFATIHYAIAKCAELGIPVLLNPAPVAPVPEEVLAKVKYLTPNEHEAAILFAGKSTEEILLGNQGKVIMTLGSKGVAYGAEDKVVNVPAFKVKPLDTTGAGDTFNGAFAVARANGLELAEAIRFGNAAAALSVQRKGAQGGMPYLKEVEEFVK